MRLFVLPKPWRRRRLDPRGVLSHRSCGLAVIWLGDTQMVWRKCTACTGGVQWYDPGRGWGQIPRSIRRELPDRVGSPQGNIRPCAVCHEVGRLWVEAPLGDELRRGRKGRR